jgi:DNA-binding MarR family transcriptional regulator
VNDRIVTARITPEGELLAQAVEKNSRGLQQKLWEGISDAEMKGLIVLLDRCLKNLDGFDDSAADY